MASIDGNPVAIEDQRFQCGAAFKLSSRPGIDWSLECDGTRTTVAAGSDYVVVARESPMRDHDRLLAEAHDAAEQSLDILAMEHLVSRRVEHGEEHHLLWWRQDGQTHLRLLITMGLGGYMNATVRVRRADGTYESDPIYVPPGWDPAMRYFRISQTDDDLFDAYRHMFLALESLLSRSNPSTPGDKAWWQQALTSISSKVQLSDFVLAPASADPVSDFVNEQYTARRCALFHSKRGAHPAPISPGSMADRRKVADALETLTGLVVALSKVELGVRVRAGGLAVGAIDSFFGWLEGRYAIAIAADADTPTFADLSVPDHESEWLGLPAKPMRHRKAYPLERRLRTTIDASDMSETIVRAYTVWVPDIGADHGPYSLLATRLRNFKAVAPLDVDDVDAFEVVVRFVIDNQRSPRRRFAY